MPLREELSNHLLPLVDGVLREADVGGVDELLGELKIPVVH